MEVDTGVRSFFFFNGKKTWEALYSFEKSRCDIGRIGELIVLPHQGLEDGRYSLMSRDYADYCIGYTRGYFGGGKFHHHWTSQHEATDDAFYKEHETLLLTLERDGFLQSYDEFSNYCGARYWALFETRGETLNYGFHVDMKHYSFYLRCIPKEESSYQIYIFAYRR